jgi:class 3 adenylate cyclase
MFDKIVAHMGVYKVENIADTYLCCDGLDLDEDDVHKDHVTRIARTALAMREAAEYFQWRWSDGSPVQFKIGIHTGIV